MKEVSASGKYDDGQLLWPRPCEHVGQRHHVVLFAMNDDGIGGHGLHGEAAHGRTD